MAAALVLIHPDYSRRRLGRAGDASGEGRGVVPPTAWLLEVAQRHGLKKNLTSGGRENSVEKERQEAAARGRPFQSGKAFCSAIVKVVGSKESSGLLTQWTAEERHFAAELGDLDADSVCSLCVVETLRFQSSLALDAPPRFHQDLWSSGSLWARAGQGLRPLPRRLCARPAHEGGSYRCLLRSAFVLARPACAIPAFVEAGLVRVAAPFLRGAHTWSSLKAAKCKQT